MKKNKLLTKVELCAKLKRGRPWLDRRVNNDPDFPIIRSKTSGQARFDYEKVRAYLDEKGYDGQRPSGHATPRQRRENAQADTLEDKLKRERGELIPVEDVRISITTMMARLAKSLDSLPDSIIKRLNLPDEAMPVIKELVDEMRKQMVADLKEIPNAFVDAE